MSEERCDDVIDECVDISEHPTEQIKNDTSLLSMHRDASLEDKEGSARKLVERKDLEEDVIEISAKSEAVVVAFESRKITKSEISNDDTSLGDSNILDISEGCKTMDHSEYSEKKMFSESPADEANDQNLCDLESNINVSDESWIDETDDDEFYCEHFAEDLILVNLKKYEKLKALSLDILENGRTCIVISERKKAAGTSLMVDRILQKLNEISEELSEECDKALQTPKSFFNTKNLFTLIQYLSILNDQEAEEILLKTKRNILEGYYNGFKSFRNEYSQVLTSRRNDLETELKKMEDFFRTDLHALVIGVKPLELTFEKWESLKVLDSDVKEWNKGMREIVGTIQHLVTTLRSLQKNVNEAFSAYFKYVKLVTRDLSIFLSTEIPNVFKELPQSI